MKPLRHNPFPRPPDGPRGGARERRITAAALGAWLALVPGVGAGEAAGTRTVTDLLERTVTVPARPGKLVAIGPGALRLVTYMGLADRLVGIERIEHRAPDTRPYRIALGSAAEDLPVVGEGGPGRLPDSERLMATSPDVIVSSFIDPSQLALLERRTDIPALALSYGATYGGSGEADRPGAVRASLGLLGEVFGREDRARELAAGMERLEAELGAVINGAGARSVYVGGLGYKGGHGLTSTEGGFLPFALLGLENAVLPAGTLGHRFVQLEALVAANPDWLFLDASGRPLIREELARQGDVLGLLGALQAGRVRWLDPANAYNTNVANAFVNAWRVAAALEPGRGISPAGRARDIYALFLGPAAVPAVMARHHGADAEPLPVGGEGR